jgi:hypothetical protein
VVVTAKSIVSPYLPPSRVAVGAGPVPHANGFVGGEVKGYNPTVSTRMGRVTLSYEFLRTPKVANDPLGESPCAFLGDIR